MNKLFRLTALCIFLPILSSAQVWMQLGDDIDGASSFDGFGGSVGISSDGLTVAIGADMSDANGVDAGHVQIYQYNSGTWTQLGDDIVGEAAGDQSGWSVRLSDDGLIVAIGAPYNNGNGDGAGQVRVYEYSLGTWTQLGDDIDGDAEDDYSGGAVRLSGDGLILAVTAVGNDDNGQDAGHVKVYEYTTGAWTQIGSNLNGEAEGDKSGWSVSLSNDGSIVAIGALYNDGNGTHSGHTRIYKNNLGTWTQVGDDIDGEETYDYSGTSVSLSSDGLTVAIGADWNDGNGDNSGHVRIYQFDGTWSQLGDDLDGRMSNDYYGWNVCMSDDGLTVAIGAITDNTNSLILGYTRVLQYDSGTWSQLGADIEDETAYNGAGSYINLSNDGTTIAIGAPYNDGNGTDAGHVRVFKFDTQVGIIKEVVSSTNLYPNPSNGAFVLELSSDAANSEIQIYNIAGALVQSFHTNKTNNKIYLSNAGAYTIVVKKTVKNQFIKSS